MSEIDPRYPVGRFSPPETIDASMRAQFIEQIGMAPVNLRRAVEGLNDEQLDTPYREGGWTLRQVVHHVPDSHLNAYVRFKLALTEENPTIKPYAEALWAQLPDAVNDPIEVSLNLLDAVHRRWLSAISQTPDDAFSRTFVHPEHNATMSLDRLLALYAWHGRHHTAHIEELRKRKGW